MNKKLQLTLFQLFLFIVWGFGQCPPPNTVIYQSDNPFISFDSLANLTAPILWFSPDQPRLKNKLGEINLPEPMPHDSLQKGSTVYYKIKEIYTPLNQEAYSSLNKNSKYADYLDLSKVIRLEIEYHYYYSFEQGAGSHGYDMEATIFQLIVHPQNKCNNSLYTIEIKRVIAKAHGLYWFDNILNVDESTQFPLSILVEEGKHASCTDKNQDGIYTPGYDVNEKPNDSWGVRDIIGTGILFTGGFQAWMAKKREPESAIFPPISQHQKSNPRNRLKVDSSSQFYQLKAFPKISEDYADKKLVKKIKSKKPYSWPRLHFNILSKKITKVERENVLRNKVGYSVVNPKLSPEFSVPLLLFKHVEAPMTGGWLYHKVYFLQVNRFGTTNGLINVFGHQIRHSYSASRWLDPYVGFGYERLSGTKEIDFKKTVFVSDLGLKIRVNITKTPLKFLRFLGIDYWGLSMGWRNRGFNDFESGSFVLGVGAGAF